MTRDLEHEISSIVCNITNGKSIAVEKRVKFFIEHTEFKPLNIEYDEANSYHMITVDFSGVE